MDVVVFGLGRSSVLAAHLLAHDSPHRPVAFTVHERFVRETHLAGLPVHPFEDVERTCPPERCALIAPLGWRRMGGLRADVVAEGRRKGYAFVSYVSSRALTWAGLSVGENSMIHGGAIIEPFARIGENCIVRGGAMLSHDADLGDHCFVSPRAMISGSTRIGANSVIGLGAVICDGLVIAPRCFIAAGAVVTADTQEGGIYRGNPARRSPVGVDRLRKLGG